MKPAFQFVWENIAGTISRKQRNDVKKHLSTVYERSTSIQDWIKNLLTDINKDYMDYIIILRNLY